MRAPARHGIVLLAALLTAAAAAAQPAATTQTFTFEQALAYSTEHYPRVRAAVEQAAAAAAGVRAAQTATLPRLEALWQINRATANNIFGQLLPQSVIPALSGPVLADASADSAWGSAAGAFVSWEPIDLGLRSAVVREAEAGVARARADEDVARLGVQQAVGNAFLRVVAAEQALAAADADVARRDVLARATHALADNQLRPGADASRADAELAAARTRAIQARQAVAIARAVFAQMLGIADAAVAVRPERLLDVAGPAATAPGAAAAHPLVQAGQAAVGAAQAREEVLATSNRPRLFLQSSVFARGSGANPDGTFDGGADGLGFERANWAAGLQVVVPNLFEFAGLRARRAAATALTRAEQARLDETVNAVAAERHTADAVVEAARAIAGNTPVQLAAARQSEAQARARYDAGLAGLVDVADAQSLLAAAEYQDALARVDVWRALLAQAVARGDLQPFVALVRAAGVP
jgi:outer membrane protein TolC